MQIKTETDEGKKKEKQEEGEKTSEAAAKSEIKSIFPDGREEK